MWRCYFMRQKLVQWNLRKDICWRLHMYDWVFLWISFLSTGVFYFLNSTINPILYSVMSKRFRRAFRDKLCRPGSCCLCFCCSEVVIIGPGPPIGPLGASQSAGAQARLRAADSHSTTTRHRILATYGRNNNNVNTAEPTRTVPPIVGVPYSPGNH